MEAVGEKRYATTTHITSLKLFEGNTEKSTLEPVWEKSLDDECKQENAAQNSETGQEMPESRLNSNEKKQNNQPSRPQQLL